MKIHAAGRLHVPLDGCMMGWDALVELPRYVVTA